MPEAGASSGSLNRAIPGFRLVEVLHESGPRVIFRAVDSAGEEVVLKTLAAPYPRKADVAEIRREFTILERLHLAGVVPVRALVPYGAGNLAIAMAPFGRSLAALLAERRPAPLSLDEALQLGLRLARILGEVHDAGLVHKDVSPQNILVGRDSSDLRLIDFSIASELSHERPGGGPTTRLEGSLPYLSPEQTGRTGRDVDYRTDYYGLGVTLFEALTGTLPFSARDPLEWVHRHLSQAPPAAHDVRPGVPPALSAIVQKLMAKAAEDRYQSSHGLIVDLERCRDGLREGRLEAFDLGRHDVPRRFQIPPRLYGREAQLDMLVELFEGVRHGAASVCLIAGPAGIGKSALVSELGRSVAGARGYLVEGKFDQFQQSAPYSALARACRDLVAQLLGEPAEALERWREDLLAALGPNARLLVDIAPELAVIIGEPPPVPALPPAEAQNRFQIVFLNFVGVFTAARRPFVLFMDDLQWSDVPTLQLLARLATARDTAYLFIIGAYRSSAVGRTHPLAVTLDQVRRTRAIVELELGPLDAEAVAHLTADTVHAGVEESRALSEAILDKTQGNPFFIREILKRLHAEGAIAFDGEAGRWVWQLSAARQALVADNVVEFMADSLRQLAPRTQRMLQAAACIGSTFDLRTLATVTSATMAEAAGALHDALLREVVVPLSGSYRVAGLDSPDQGTNAKYRFQHDRVQQAAYELVATADRPAMHLAVGRLLVRHTTPEETEERLIDIVGHLNTGRGAMDDPAERHGLAGLNLKAGRKAMASSAYASALGFLRVGQELLGEQPWDRDFPLMFALSREVQQCAYLTGDFAEADRWADVILARAPTPLEKADVLSARTRQLSTMGRMRESMEAAFEGLACLGIEMAASPSADDVARETSAVEGWMAGREVASLIHAPEVTDPNAQIAIRILMEVFPAAFLSGSGRLFPYLVLKAVNLSLRHGASPDSAFSYAAYGMLLCGALNNPALGCEFGKLAVAMNERFEDVALKARILYVYTMFVHHWSNHWSSMTPWFLKGIAAGYQAGDLLYLAYSAQDCVLWDPTLDLATATREQRKYLAIVKDCQYQDSYDSGTLYLQMQLSFQGLTAGPFSMNDDGFDEARCVEGMRQRKFMTGIANYHIYKAEMHALYGDFAGALEHVRVQDGLVASAMSLPQLVRFYIVSFLTRAARYPAMAPDEQAETRARLEADLAQMTAWARHCPENFEHLRLTMEAERARIDGRTSDALALYDAAAAAAAASGFLRDEAVAYELAARCLLAGRLRRAAEGYLRAARHVYDRWGARRKVEQLDRDNGDLAGAPAGQARADASTARTLSVDASSLDAASVIKASQTISGELLLDQLLRTTLHIMLENAGGQRGCLVVREQETLVIRAFVDTDASAEVPETPLRVSPESAPVLPFTIINSVLRTGAPVVLGDASRASRFARDPYLLARHPRSVLCVPIRRHDRYIGAVYIEHHASTDAFPEARVEVVSLLAMQAAISIENASLFEGQVRLTDAQRRFVPTQFLSRLGHTDIAKVGLGEFVRTEMSVLFADLRDFTPLSERLEPQAVIALLNRYFSRVSGPVAETGGFIDSFNGDEIMALFPLPADGAVEAAVRMRRALAEFNRESAAGGGPALELGIGINTGPLVLGTVGSADRLKCGVVGDTVNTAARIEQLTKRYGTPLLIGEATRHALSDASRYSLRAVDRVAAKGKAQALTLFEVLDAETPARRAAKEATRDRLALGLARYVQRDFAGAVAAFDEGRASDPADRVLAILAERARRYGHTPPPADWRGDEVLTEK